MLLDAVYYYISVRLLGESLTLRYEIMYYRCARETADRHMVQPQRGINDRDVKTPGSILVAATFYSNMVVFSQ